MRWWWWTWWWWWCWRVAWGSTLRCRLPVCTLWQFPSILLFCVFSFFLFPFTGQTGFPLDRSTWKSVHGFPVYYEGQLSWSCCGQGWNWMCWGHYQRKNDYWLLSIFIFKVWGVIYTRTLVGHMTTLRHDPGFVMKRSLEKILNGGRMVDDEPSNAACDAGPWTVSFPGLLCSCARNLKHLYTDAVIDRCNGWWG